DLNFRQGERRVRMRHRLADIDAFHARDRQDVSRYPDRFINALQALKGVKLRDLRLLERTIQFRDSHVIAEMQRSIEDAADRETAEILAVVQIGDEQLQDSFGVS